MNRHYMYDISAQLSTRPKPENGHVNDPSRPLAALIQLLSLWALWRPFLCSRAHRFRAQRPSDRCKSRVQNRLGGSTGNRRGIRVKTSLTPMQDQTPLGLAPTNNRLRRSTELVCHRCGKALQVSAKIGLINIGPTGSVSRQPNLSSGSAEEPHPQQFGSSAAESVANANRIPPRLFVANSARSGSDVDGC